MAKVFLHVLAALYPLVVFCFLVIFKLPLRLTALFMGFLGLVYFVSVSAKKKEAIPGGVFGGRWPVLSSF
ncbi:MAG: hypothetical protein LBG57_14150 [Treponema sp.]|jgi:hypothetical protein|nr:hypothetical protein [Treponema sp.]